MSSIESVGSASKCMMLTPCDTFNDVVAQTQLVKDQVEKIAGEVTKSVQEALQQIQDIKKSAQDILDKVIEERKIIEQATQTVNSSKSIWAQSADAVTHVWHQYLSPVLKNRVVGGVVVASGTAYGLYNGYKLVRSLINKDENNNKALLMTAGKMVAGFGMAGAALSIHL